jgi:hypothetical protein
VRLRKVLVSWKADEPAGAQNTKQPKGRLGSKAEVSRYQLTRMLAFPPTPVRSSPMQGTALICAGLDLALGERTSTSVSF